MTGQNCSENRSIEYGHEHCRDPNGRYSRRWETTAIVAALDPVRLIDEAAETRAFWILSHGVEQ
jgi:hypothetical protein